jgi:hypothetical protein
LQLNPNQNQPMKKFYFALLLILCGVGLMAQPVITSSFNPVPGDQYKYHPVNTQITAGNSGANVVWDFSTIQVIYNPITGKYLNPASTPYSTDFQMSTIAYEDYFAAGTYHYYTTSATKLEKVGEASVLLTAVYSQPATMYTYPFTYNTKVTTNYGCTTAVGSLTLHKTASWEAEGDAYGTLMLPSGTFQNILRIKTRHIIEDDYVGTVTNKQDITEYIWVSTTSKKPYLKITTTIHSTNGTTIDTVRTSLISDDVSAIGGAVMGSVSALVYPNPAQDQIILEFNTAHSANIGWSLFSADGQLIFENSAQNYSPGTHLAAIPVAALSPGCYFVRITSNEGSRVLRFMKT